MSETLYILEPGAWLKKDGGSLMVMKNNVLMDRIPGHGLKRLILMGRVSITSGVVDFLLENKVETVFAGPTGRFRARLGVDADSHVERRRAQYFTLSDPACAADVARIIVSGKIGNMAALLARRGRDYGLPDLSAAAVRLKACLPKETEPSMETIRGHEGLAARIYFSAFSHLIRNDAFTFTGRNKRPPLDPVNAMLSYVYTVLTVDVLSAIRTVGLDPYLGTLHDIAYGRPSLACDLVEEFRTAVADRLVLGLLNRKALTPGDFIFRSPVKQAYADDADMAANRPVEMKPTARSRLMSAYEEIMNSTVMGEGDAGKTKMRTLILKQARLFSDSLSDGGKTYRPFVWTP